VRRSPWAITMRPRELRVALGMVCLVAMMLAAGGGRIGPAAASTADTVRVRYVFHAKDRLCCADGISAGAAYGSGTLVGKDDGHLLPVGKNELTIVRNRLLRSTYRYHADLVSGRLSRDAGLPTFAHLVLTVSILESSDPGCPAGSRATVLIRDYDPGRDEVSYSLHCGGGHGDSWGGTLSYVHVERAVGAFPLPTQTLPTKLTLTVNGKSDSATVAHPSNDDPVPLVVPSGMELTIRAVADHPMPKGWMLFVRRTGDPLSHGNGDYYLVCQTLTTASCGAMRPGLDATAGDRDDLVYAGIGAPTYLARNVQILIKFKKS
jgi:hypothetical protein